MVEPVKPGDSRKSESEIVARYNIEVPTAKSLFIETRYRETVVGNATGFLAANDQQSHCALITNRHVVTGRHQDTGECLHSQGGIPDNVVIYFHKNAESIGDWKPIALPLFRPDGSPYWIEHPRLGGAADVVALNLSWANDVWKFPYYMKTTLDRPDLVLGPARYGQRHRLSVRSIVGCPLPRLGDRFSGTRTESRDSGQPRVLD